MDKGLLSELLERVRKAEGPDRELDALIRSAFPHSYESRVRPAQRPGTATAHYGSSGTWGTFIVPDLTSSVDDVLQLIWRVDPGFCWRCERRTSADGMAPDRAVHPFWATCGLPSEQEHATGATPALALLAAMLTALLETQDV